MSEVLYRKYRPQRFDEVVGQKHVLAVLTAAIIKNRISHAYLFSGPRGTGKTTVARIFARAINCQSKKLEARPCNDCDICREFVSGATLDLIEIDAASSRGIDEIRALKEAVEMLPFRSKYKVYIIDEVHMLTKEAFNALLKTLEEPPLHIVFILATTEIDKVPETIISRVQHFEFRRIPEEDLVGALAEICKKEKLRAEPEALGIIAALAEGSLRDAQSVLDQALAFSEGEIKSKDVRLLLGVPGSELLEKLILALISNDTKSGIQTVQKSILGGTDIKAFFKMLIRNFRFMLYLKVVPEHEKELEKIISKKELAFLKENSDKTETNKIEQTLSALNESYDLLKAAYLPQLALELAVLKITN
ncbi:DNA polymerase III subunit gamma/tau [Candidatus Giovannonibacteria bacterium]|nr:DNA polymerase III subunit gamma/tau [Candidatus Giovannonibacteria bacterium]